MSGFLLFLIFLPSFFDWCLLHLIMNFLREWIVFVSYQMYGRVIDLYWVGRRGTFGLRIEMFYNIVSYTVNPLFHVNKYEIHFMGKPTSSCGCLHTGSQKIGITFVLIFCVYVGVGVDSCITRGFFLTGEEPVTSTKPPSSFPQLRCWMRSRGDEKPEGTTLFICILLFVVKVFINLYKTYELMKVQVLKKPFVTNPYVSNPCFRFTPKDEKVRLNKTQTPRLTVGNVVWSESLEESCDRVRRVCLGTTG